MLTKPSPPAPVEQASWGIIRYAAGSGRLPQEDAAAFDGWYTDRAVALEVAADWVRKHPQWIVGLVRSDLLWFGDGDFATVAERPLTVRERKFAEGHP
jgi:hypothetical protein